MFDVRPDVAVSERNSRNTSSTFRGRVIHDPRGTAVWDWAIATGVLAKATTAQLLETLADPTSLSLVPESGQSQGWAGDPYNRY